MTDAEYKKQKDRFFRAAKRWQDTEKAHGVKIGKRCLIVAGE